MITGELREKEHALLYMGLTHLHWADGLTLLVAAIGIALSSVAALSPRSSEIE